VDCQKFHAVIKKHGVRMRSYQCSKGKEVWKMEKGKSTEAWKEYKKSRQNANSIISIAKGKKLKKCTCNSNDPHHENEISRTTKQMVKERQDITGLKCLKEVSAKVTVDEKGIKDSWKKYMEN